MNNKKQYVIKDISVQSSNLVLKTLGDLVGGKVPVNRDVKKVVDLNGNLYEQSIRYKFFKTLDKEKIDNINNASLRNKSFAYHHFYFSSPNITIKNIKNNELIKGSNQTNINIYTSTIINKNMLFSSIDLNNFDKQNLNYVPEYNLITIPKITVKDENIVKECARIIHTKDSYDEQDVYKLLFAGYHAKLGEETSATFYDTASKNDSILKVVKFSDVENASNLRQLDGIKKTFYISEKNLQEDGYIGVSSLRNSLSSLRMDYFNNLLNKEEITIIPLFFKISKFKEGVQSPIQEIYITNNNKEINYIDSQITTGEKYTYACSVIFLSPGFIFNMTSEDDGQGFVYFKFSRGINVNKNFTQDIQLLELNILSDSQTSETEKSNNIPTEESEIFPAIPEAKIMGISGDANNIKIFMSTKIAKEKKVFGDDGKYYNFTNTNFSDFFIYRLEEAPVNYNSFLMGNIKSFSSSITEFYDYIKSNKKYYYMFRSFDGSNFSNPSDIYEVQIKHDGNIIPIIKNYMFSEQEQQKTISTNFTKNIEVLPSFYQLNLKPIGDTNTYKNKNASYVSFDISKYTGLESVFGEKIKYKLRIKSKSSGKMIDINIKYKNDLRNLLEEK